MSCVWVSPDGCGNGFTCLITPVVQADFYLGKGLNANGADLILGGGFSFRFSY
ncbi:hypothetical protein JW992_10370 [candidate division KSB1 bacterium]|nr:hypothetical protein [candidate division KSB1 bacterium]